MKWLERRILGKTIGQLLNYLKRASFVSLALVALGLAVYWIPIRQTRDLVGPLQSQEVLELQNKLRATCAQIVGGIFLLLGLYATWRRTTAAEEQVKVAQEGQITDRFTRAVDQLGSEKLEIRLGGIYALERIARDSERDHWTVMEVLSAFVRERAAWAKSDDEIAAGLLNLESPAWMSSAAPLADVQAVLTVIGRRSILFREKETGRLNFFGVSLRLADFSGGYWAKTNFKGAHLEASWFCGANLTRADFTLAFLADADLRGADLTGAVLFTSSPVLQEASFDESTTLPNGEKWSQGVEPQ